MCKEYCKDLPKRFKNWSEFYRYLKRECEQNGYSFDNSEYCNYKDLSKSDNEAIYSIEFIKAKAFDEIVAELPTEEEGFRVLGYLSVQPNSSMAIEIQNKVLNVILSIK